MTLELNHTIIRSRDQDEAARFLAELLDLSAPRRFGPFTVVETTNRVSLDFATEEGVITPQHYAFLTSDERFDAIFQRVVDRGLEYWADPGRTRPHQVREYDGSRGFYVEDPSGHFLEVLTPTTGERAR